jgi:cytochrome c oxidase cbb3-type subunit 2
MANHHEKIEKSVVLMSLLTVVAISFGALVEITPLMFQKDTTEPVKNMRALTALEMEGRDIYIREGCNNCHSQMIRPFRSEVERYGHYSVAGESVWDHPFLWGSKRTGPDLARVGQRYSDDWHYAHLMDPRSVVPQSNMPAFKWLDEAVLTGEDTGKKFEVFNILTKGKTHKDENGEYIPLYSAEDIAGAKAAVEGKTEMDALIAYLQQLGTHLK